MSDTNIAEGKELYLTGDEESKKWFVEQWKQWPNRVHEDKTTNISFHFGGVLGYREIHKTDPELSKEFKSHVEWLDKHSQIN